MKIDDFIKREAAEMIFTCGKENWKDYEAAACIAALPAADVRPVVRGRWVEFETDTPPRRNGCSECGYITNPWLAHVYNFCPNCGADMREES